MTGPDTKVHVSRQSAGRRHPEPPDVLRNPFELDRQRILSSAAFRRLVHKTQVFAPSLSDHFRTRLTHTLEAAHLARLLSNALGANEQLAEAIALAHDLGHPPFGHAGETALEEVMCGHGGFNHNAHSLRVVEYLEHPFPGFRGLNLTLETLAGLESHVTRYDTPESGSGAGAPERCQGDGTTLPGECSRPPSVESEIASLADRLAYNTHDLEDAIGADLLTFDDLAELEPWRRAFETTGESSGDRSLYAVRRPVIDAMIDHFLEGVIVATSAAARTAERGRRFRSPIAPPVSPIPAKTELESEASQLNDLPRVVLPPSVGRSLQELEEFLLEGVYRHPDIARADADARRTVVELFRSYLDCPSHLPPRFASRISDQGPHRVIADYIAGMTDRFCLQDHARRVDRGV